MAQELPGTTAVSDKGRAKPLLLTLGIFLLVLGTAVEGAFAGMGLEALFLNLGPPQIVRDSSGDLRSNPEWETYRESSLPVVVALAVLLGIAGAVVGFFASKGAPKTWYFVITGVIPGLLLFGAWKVVRMGRPPERGPLDALPRFASATREPVYAPASKTTCDQCQNSFPSSFYLEKSQDGRFVCEKCRVGQVPQA